MAKARSPLMIPEGRGPTFRIVLSVISIALAIWMLVTTLHDVRSGMLTLGWPHRYGPHVPLYRAAQPVGFSVAGSFWLTFAAWLLYASVGEIRYALRYRDRLSREQGKPIIYPVVVLPIVVGGGLALMLALTSAYAHSHGIAFAAVPDRNGILIGLPAFFLWIPIAFMLGNCVLHFVPSLRRIAEDYVARSGRSGYQAAQLGLAKAALIIAVICVPLIVIGFIL